MSIPDFSQAGSDGAPDTEPTPWRRGIVYTRRPDQPVSLDADREYQIVVSFKRKRRPGERGDGYSDVYRRVRSIAETRISQLNCTEPGIARRLRIICHGWRSLGEGEGLTTAFVAIGLLYAARGDDAAPAEPEPNEEDLKQPGGTPLDALSRLVPKRADEIYNEFDFTDGSTASAEPLIVSYGESVSRCEGIDFQPFIRRAEQFADFYQGLVRNLAASPSSEPIQMIRRRWYCVTDPNLVTVELLFHLAI